MGENSCIVCRAASNRRCSACGTATYCSPKHQKEDWKHHRPNCKIYKIAKNDKVGRHLIATRTITEGTIIFDEAPIVVGPKIYSLPICLGCYKRVNGSYFCTRCGYPMCSAECESTPVHQDNECKIFQRKGSGSKQIENYEQPHPLYQSILPLRCLLLKESQPDKWKELLTLEDHLETRKRRSEVWDEQQVNIVKFLRDWHMLGTHYTEDTVNRVIGLIEVNSFQIKTVKKIEYCGIFLTSAMMSHDCTPNTHHAFTEEGNLILRSSVTIQKNSEITMSYVGTLLGTSERRQNLEQSKYFSCDCRRCADPTELGTFISGIKCDKCSGYLLPQNPLDSKSNWVCYSETTKQKSSPCTKMITAPDAVAIEKRESSRLESLTSETNIAEIENSLRQTICHRNHFLVLPVLKHLNKLWDLRSAETKDIKDLQKSKDTASHLLSILSVLNPGLTRERGILQYQLYKLDKSILESDLSSGNIEKEEFDEAVEKVESSTTLLKKLFELDTLIGVKS